MCDRWVSDESCFVYVGKVGSITDRRDGCGLSI